MNFFRIYRNDEHGLGNAMMVEIIGDEPKCRAKHMLLKDDGRDYDMDKDLLSITIKASVDSNHQ